MTNDTMKDRCLVHARVSTRQAVIKGLDREILADALMKEALTLAFGISEAEAVELAGGWKEEAFRRLDADYVTRLPDGAPRLVRLLRSETRAKLLGSSSLQNAKAA